MKWDKLTQLRAGLFLSAVLATGALFQFYRMVSGWGFLAISAKWRGGVGLLFLLLAVGWMLVTRGLTSGGNRYAARLEKATGWLNGWGQWGWLPFVFLMLLFPLLLYGPLSGYLSGYAVRLFLLWVFTLLGAACLGAALPQRSGGFRLAASILIFAALFQAARYFYDVNGYPFALFWSEPTQYFYASLFVAQKVYGVPMQLPVVNPGRSMLGILPFLFPHPSLWVARLWEALLWVGTTFLTAYRLRRRLATGGKVQGLLAAAWGGLYLFQGPVYYHLLLTAILVLWGFDPRRSARSWLFVLLASAWAGLCRINWYPLPGMLAALLYFMEIPMERKGWRYFIPPFAWVVIGSLTAFGTLTAYTRLSGNTSSHASTSLSSPLLWYRLLPNATYPLGVLLTALLAALPGLLLIGFWFKARGRDWNGWRLSAPGLILLVFFLGGLLVSVKIGGGNNLHNLDAFWVLLMVATSYLLLGKLPPDLPEETSPYRPPAAVVWAILLAPVLLTLSAPAPTPLPSAARVQQVLSELRQNVQKAVEKGQPVLLISNKHLIPFGYMGRVPMVGEYEIVEMMEMAMSNNKPYYSRFYQDLQKQKFGLILTNQMYTNYKASTASYGEENDLEVSYITKPLLCYYAPLITWEDIHLQLYAPRAQPTTCQ